MFGDRVVCTAVDLVRAAHCEFAMLRALDTELGTLPAEPGIAAPAPERAPDIDDARQRQLADYRARFPGAVVEIDRPPDNIGDPAEPSDGVNGRTSAASDGPSGRASAPSDGVSGRAAARIAALTAAHTDTIAALRAGAHVVHGATFFDGRFHSSCDFLVRAEHRVRYTVHGAAPTAADRVGAALELAACAAALDRSGALTAPFVRLHLGEESMAEPLSELLPVYRARRRRVERIVDEKLGELLPVQWGDPRYLACGRCRTCTAALSTARDLLLVAGMASPIRARLREAGVSTIDRLAAGEVSVPGVPPRTITALRRQAEIQLRREVSDEPTYALTDPTALGALPPPSPGDLALTIGGGGRMPRTVEIGGPDTVRLSLRGPSGPDEPGGAASAERRALDQVLDYLAQRRRMYPDLHIYHYTSAARTALLHCAGQHSVGEEFVDELLRAGVLVDLYPVIRNAMIIGEPSYDLSTLRQMWPDAEHSSDDHTVLRLRDWLLDCVSEQRDTRASAWSTVHVAGEEEPAPPSRRSSPGAGAAEHPAGPEGAQHPVDHAAEQHIGPQARAGSWRTPDAPDAPEPTPPSRRSSPGAAATEYPAELEDAQHPVDHAAKQHIGPQTRARSWWTPDAPEPAPPSRRSSSGAGAAEHPAGPEGAQHPVDHAAEQHIGTQPRAGSWWTPDAPEPAPPSRRSSPGAGAAEYVGGPEGAQHPAEQHIGTQAGAGSWWTASVPGAPPSRPSSLEAALAEYAAGLGDSLHPAALMAAALGYHRRERQPLWWAHADRLSHPVDEWPDAPGVLVADWGTVDTKWHRRPDLPTMRRYLTLTGRIGTGSSGAAGPSVLTPGTTVYTFYDQPPPAGMVTAVGHRATATATVLGCSVDTEFDDTVRLEELLPGGCEPYDELPTAIAPDLPEWDENAELAVELAAQQLLMTLPDTPREAVFDILARRPPRLHGGARLPEVHGDHAAAITAAVRALDRSYVAVQGPSGTGKTSTTARVLERLVTKHNWRVGIVAQDHATVENLLDAIVRVGVLPELVAKKDAAAVAPEWAVIDAARYPRFLDNAISGCVLGGTPADFANDDLVPRESLDLLLIADAGRFALADTVAVAASARNLLLLGDPVPSAARGTHPVPVGESVLGWLAEGRQTLPSERGYFLDRTWRMHPAVCEPVSRLYYDGRLRSNETVTLARRLDGEEPGVQTVLVDHYGNATTSPAEAREVVRRVRALLGMSWTIGATTRRVHPHDIFVVAPYAAQVGRIRTMLARAKIEDVLVGTPDRFRGREAAVVLLSMTTSSPADAPYDMRSLLSRGLIRAALCRAMWKAIIIRSPLLTEYLPATMEELADLGAFLRLG
ncbi:AAA domain-containing protein [Nocardia amamiensis]|uniref:AAA domain-containing protein n=1 Tax=Nocardia amamiensis TaxID=404578 RepID=UPI001FDFAB69|nr:AAA domain-containing protein [Nocardia amamiensis]